MCRQTDEAIRYILLCFVDSEASHSTTLLSRAETARLHLEIL